MNNRPIIQLVIVLASIVLGMILYPILVRKWKQFVDWLYVITYGKREKTDKVGTSEKTGGKDKIASILGESKTIIGHSRTNTSKRIDYEKDTKKESTFVPPLESEPEKFDVDVPLEREQPMTQNEMEKEEESLEDKPDKDAAVASGASYDDLMKTGEIIRKEESTEQEKDLAGQTLYENRNTEIVETMAASDKQHLEKINSLIHFHMKKHNLNEEEEPFEPDEFNGFDFNSIF